MPSLARSSNHEFEGLRALEDERGNDDCHAPSAIQRHETARVPLWLDSPGFE